MRIDQHHPDDAQAPGARRLLDATGHHICLAGPSIANNWPLIELLKRRHQVTIVEPVELLADNGLLATVDIVALDCSGQPRSGANLIRSFRATYPELRFVLVNGGLSQTEIANAFREGAEDYFSSECGTDLLVERIEHICRRLRKSRTTVSH